MHAILKRLLPEDDKHMIIDGATRIEIVPNSLMTFKIPCQNRLTPCRVRLTYSKDSSRDVDVYVSQETSVPSAEKCQIKVLGGPSLIEVSETTKSKVFTVPHIYLSLYSQDGSCVLITPKFADETKAVSQTAIPRSRRADPIVPEPLPDKNNPENPFYEYYQRLKREKEMGPVIP